MTRLSPRILVVDDQEANVRLLEGILRRAGYAAVEGTTDSRTVEDLVRERRPDLVLLDLHMPHLDGFTLLERLSPAREAEGYLPVLVLTADGDPDSRRRALRLGATDFVAKPFDVDEVLLRCENLLETRRLYRAVAEQNRRLAERLVSQTTELRDARAARELVRRIVARLPAGASLGDRVATFRAELARTPWLDAVAVVGLEAGQAVPIEEADGAPEDRAPRRRLSNGLATGLRARAAHGPWWERVAEGALPGDGLLSDGRLRAIWWAPLAHGDELIGLLAIGTRDTLSDAEIEARVPDVAGYAAVARALLGDELLRRHREAEARAAILEMIEHGGFYPVFQPVVDLRTRVPVGYEALTRFRDGVRPDRRFAEAQALGLGVRLEEATLGASLAAARELPESAWLSLNCSPDLVLAPGVLDRFLEAERRSVVVEITEHVAIADYDCLQSALRSLRPRVRLAIDDAGAGFASLRHVLRLEPEFVKLDADLVRGIETDTSRQALVVGMQYFAERTGCALIGEGVETEAERAMLESLGVALGQGFLFGRPEPLPRT
ncbi:MAG TPA: EAL domain-containing protein [Candidatus Limnocylindrales bacterium]|nr:EAL domain-containing protein [Candidatus Limnocylindrales bacterium]